MVEVLGHRLGDGSGQGGLAHAADAQHGHELAALLGQPLGQLGDLGLAAIHAAWLGRFAPISPFRQGGRSEGRREVVPLSLFIPWSPCWLIRKLALPDLLIQRVVVSSGSMPSPASSAWQQAAYWASAAPRSPPSASARISCWCACSRQGSSSIWRRAVAAAWARRPAARCCSVRVCSAASACCSKRSRASSSHSSKASQSGRLKPASNSPR